MLHWIALLQFLILSSGVAMSDEALSLTDAGNAERFARRWEGKLFYVPGIDWHIYDGRRWAEDKTGAVMECAKQTVRELLQEAVEHVADDRHRAELTAWALKSQDYRALGASHGHSNTGQNRIWAALL